MRKKAGFLLGLFLVISYWLWIHPAGLKRGYVEDYCTFEMSRQIMGDHLKEIGRPQFHTQHYAYPSGISTAFMPQSIEQTWLGGYFWNWNRDFPYFWVYYGISLLITFLGVGWIVKQMGLSPHAAWGLSTLVTVIHIPRHFVTWYHSEHLYQHWIYLGFFLDAWIWQRFYRENRWSWKLECWRGFLVIATFGTAGYFWGPALVEWAIVRFSMLGFTWVRRYQGHSPRIDDRFRSILVPALFCLLWIGIELPWFIPLLQEAKSLGSVPQNLGYHSSLTFILRPLWSEWAFQGIEKIIPSFEGKWWSFRYPETTLTIGWIFWIPALMGLNGLRKKKGGVGIGAGFPFLILLLVAIWYITIRAHWFHHILQTLVPFMLFFRVANRWGLFLPQMMGALIALSWPELSRWFKSQWNLHPRKFRISVYLFIGFSILESTWLFYPVSMMEPLSTPMVHFLEEIKNSPGTAVLDIPFCLTGGNGICFHQCNAYPYSTAGACFRQWHDKDVFGIYQSRTVPKQCEIYDSFPFRSWVSAWREQRCFSNMDWESFCRFLEEHSELSAILIYPELWKAAEEPECKKQIEAHLGLPLAESQFFGASSPGGHGKNLLRVIRYPTHCKLIH